MIPGADRYVARVRRRGARLAAAAGESAPGLRELLDDQQRLADVLRGRRVGGSPYWELWGQLLDELDQEADTRSS